MMCTTIVCLDGVRIAGWYAVPRERSGKLPAIVQVPGYLQDPPIPRSWAEDGYAAFSVAPLRRFDE